MSEFQRLVDEAVYALEGLENGSVSAADTYNRIKGYDPVVIYFMIRYLREKYPPTNQASQGVMARVLELTSTYEDIVKASRQGEKDVLREWFDENYNMREFFNNKEEYFNLIYEKLEG